MSLPHENTHICPKCGSKDIFVIDGHTDAYDAGNVILSERGISIVRA